jgi:predicted ferric reductase
MTINHVNASEYESSLTAKSVLVLFAAMVLGVLAAVLILPGWLPGLAGSLSGTEPKAFWYLSRASALVALGMLSAAMMLGVGITNKMARLWPGAPATCALHEYLSVLGLGFAAFHGLILLGDHYSKFSLVQILVPFATSSYHPLWVGLGQLAFYSWALLVASFYVRRRMGPRTWRLLHYLSFLVYLGAIFHGLASGSDSALSWVQGYYWLTGSSFLFLFFYRVINTLVGKVEKHGKPGKKIRELFPPES